MTPEGQSEALLLPFLHVYRRSEIMFSKAFYLFKENKNTSELQDWLFLSDGQPTT